MTVYGCGLLRRSMPLLRMLFFMAVVFIFIGYLVPVKDSVKSFQIVPSTLSRLCPAAISLVDQQLPVVMGIPTKKFRDNLRNDTYYITGWSSAGLTNAVMNLANMIYLGKLTNRVPIIPPFAPDQHISKNAGIVPFGDIFDLELLRKTLNMDILDWRDVKELPSRYSVDPYSTSEVEQLGCWTTMKDSSSSPVAAGSTVHHIGLDVSYTRVPLFVRLQTNSPNYEEMHVVLPQLAALVYPQNPLVDPAKTEVLTKSPEGHSRTPDTHLACFDSLYYASSGVKAFEWEKPWSPVWHTIGKNLRFTQAVEDLAHSYMVQAFGLTSHDDWPHFITIHIRHGDFRRQCKSHSHSRPDDGNDCFPPPSAYQKHVDEIKEELLAKRQISVSSVIVMSDETSTTFWDDIKAQGWVFINHTEEATVERYGEWYAPLIDTVIQSHAIGFVGTKSSTFSLVGERRVQDWNGGVYRDVSIRDKS